MVRFEDRNRVNDFDTELFLVLSQQIRHAMAVGSPRIALASLSIILIFVPGQTFSFSLRFSRTAVKTLWVAELTILCLNTYFKFLTRSPACFC